MTLAHVAPTLNSLVSQATPDDIYPKKNNYSPMETKTTSVYPSAINSNSIRLLQFSQSSHGAPFTGKLKKFRLEDAPPFYTASYAWGDKGRSPNSFIQLKSGNLPVLSSLTPFLEMVSAHKDFSAKDWWWFDSLCINLRDMREREDQVKIMGKIYKKTQRVIIWLGEEVEKNSDCTGAMEFLFQLSVLPPAFRTSKALRDELLEAKFAQHWGAVGRLLSRKWWTRVWTLQEMVLPKEAKLFCGIHSINRGKFKSALYNIHLCSTGTGDYANELIPRSAFDAAFNRRRIHQWYGRSSGMNLVALMAYLGNHAATDARDMVYSVLGLVRKRDSRLVGTADYKASVHHVYAKLVRSFWNEYQSLDLICFSHMFNRNAGIAHEEICEGNLMPSWAPDWRYRVEFSSPVPLMASQSASEHIGNFRPLGSNTFNAVYDAPGPRLRARTNVRFHKNLKEMWCNGIILDTIEGLGGLEGCETRCRSRLCKDLGHDMVQIQHHAGESNVQQSQEIVEAIARSLVLDRRDKYLRLRAPEHYISSFLTLCILCMRNEPVDDLFRAWFQQNQSLLFDGRTLLDHITTLMESSPEAHFDAVSPPLPQSHFFSPLASPSSTHTDADPEPPEPPDSFLSRVHDTIRKKSRRLMVTRLGYIGMAPCRARLGEVVAVLFGCCIPLVLRRVGSREAWVVIGEAYVEGFMNGEVERLVAEELEQNLRLV